MRKAALVIKRIVPRQTQARFVKRQILCLLLLLLAGQPEALAYDCVFSSEEAFLRCETADAPGLWFWQVYSAADNAYIDADMYADGKRYLSGNAANRLPGGDNRVFYGVKTFRVPYASDLLIDLTDTVSGDGTDSVKLKIVKNDEALFPTDTEWCTAEVLNNAPTISVKAETGDMIRFIVAPKDDLPLTADCEIRWRPNVVLRSDGQFVKNATLTIQGTYEVYDAADGFSDVQGENGWTYMRRCADDGTEYAQERYSHADAVWQDAFAGTGGQIGADFMCPGTDPAAAFDVMRVFTAPADGTVSVSSVGKIAALEPDAADAFGVKIRILHNGETVYPGDADWAYITSREETIDLKRVCLSVKQGDRISFEVGRTIPLSQAKSPRRNAVRWTPKVVYEETAEVRFALANYSQPRVSFYPVIAAYNEGRLTHAHILDNVVLSENEQVSRSISVLFSECTELKLLLLADMTAITPCDTVTKLYAYEREGK